MHTFRLAMAQMNPTVGDLDGNTRTILRLIGEARTLGADLVAFPEMALTGYPPEDLLLKPQFVHDSLKFRDQVVAQTQDIAVVLGCVDRNEHLYNTAAVAYDGKLVGVYHKIYLPNYGVFDERRYFEPGMECPVYVINGVSVGVNVCEDIWYEVGPTEVQCVAGAELIININGSPYHAGKLDFREQMLAARAVHNRAFVSYTNMVGGQDELVFDGGGLVLDPHGQLLVKGCQFEEEMVVVDLDIDAVRTARREEPQPGKSPDELARVGTPSVVHVSDYRDPGQRPELPKHRHTALQSLEEVYAALVVGTRDYVRKNGFQKVLIGLSGGIDSSLTAVVAADALGKENVVGVSMPSRYSSEGSIVDARLLAENLGIELQVIALEQAFGAYLDMLEPQFRGTQPGVAEENLQARIRGNILMGLSNKFGWLVLTTGNKSELATGYSTLYGDMAGGFSVIKDVPKTLVYTLSGYVNRRDGLEVIPQAVIDKPPSAELRPDQRDQDSLPPYDVLDSVLKAYVEEDRSYAEIVEMGFDPQIVQQVIKLVDHSEHKRRQAPPGVKITPRNFGRDRRMPIVNRYRQF
ncbi:MAG: NAD+ synthase [Chloroflexi bacterium]|nr:NAD+ synthase [Chloroflexota bacterium]